jgi:hypothetical protein
MIATKAWWTEPCKYGHFDCSYTEDGPCGDENHPPDEADIAVAVTMDNFPRGGAQADAFLAHD